MSAGEVFYREAESDKENSVTVSKFKDDITVSVSEERAVDRFNQTFHCSFKLGRPGAVALRDWLLVKFPITPP